MKLTKAMAGIIAASTILSLTDDKSGKYLTDHLGSLALLRKKSHQLCGYQDYRQILKAIYHNMISFLSLISDFTP